VQGATVSATNRGGERAHDDVYATPAWCVRRLLEACPLPNGRWLEPACGDGAIVRAVKFHRSPDVWGMSDIRRVDVPGAQQADFLSPGAWGRVTPFDVIITNPPYSLAEPFVRRALELAPHGHVVMLLRLAWLASARRAPLMRANAPDVYVLPNRPSFTGGRTDSTDYGWFVWTPRRGRASGTVTVLATTPAEERHQPPSQDGKARP